MEFRLLRADEIDCRISRVNEYGVQLLLYKDARCDQNILDERVGSMNWQRHHTRDNANCIVSIWDSEKKQWIEKEDTGTESYTEAEKGLASDSFKRACFNWGIGRELYTAPNMFVNNRYLDKYWKENGKWFCKDLFKVTDIEYENKKITFVRVLNTNNDKYIDFGTPANGTERVDEEAKELASKPKIETIKSICKKHGLDADKLIASKERTWETLTEHEATMLIIGLKKKYDDK